jgi:hypothetical protein
MPTSAQDIVLDGLSLPPSDLSGLYTNPDPPAAFASYFAHRGNLWEPILAAATDSEQKVDSGILRYLGIHAYRRAVLPRDTADLMGRWPGGAPANMDVWIFPEGTLISNTWAIIDQTVRLDGANADSYGSCWICEGPPKQVSSSVFSEEGRVKVYALRLPRAPEWVG